MKKEIYMLAGGAGLTPMMQLIKAITSDPADKTQVTLIFSNTTEKDILLKEELDALAGKHENLHVYHVVSKPSSSWRGLSGHVSKESIGRLLPSPSRGGDVMVLVCGPQGFYQTVSGTKAKDYTQGELSGFLKDMGFAPSQVFKF